MLAGGARTGTVGYGEHDGPPRGPWTRAAGAVAADERDGGLGALDMSAANSTVGTRRPVLVVASPAVTSVPA